MNVSIFARLFRESGSPVLNNRGLLLFGLVCLLLFPGAVHAGDLLGHLQSAESAEYPVWLLFILIAAGTLISEDLTCVTAGLLAANGAISFFTGVAACFTGILFGDLSLYFAGRIFGREIIKYRPFRWMLNPESLEASAERFKHTGILAVFVSRFIPGSRIPVFVAAGVLRISFRRLLFFFVLACLIWTPLLVGLSMKIGDQLMGWLTAYSRAIWIIIPVLALIIWLAAELVLPLFNRRGRRLVRGKWQRLTQWEYWPLWIFYIPVVFYVLWLAVKHRSVTLFTAANPGMPAGGGVIGESKSEILSNLNAGQCDVVASFELIQPHVSQEEQMDRIRAFQEATGTLYPLVCKPDKGQRGRGVAVVRNEEQLNQYLQNHEEPFLVQEYVQGTEYGVFYVRHPGEENGRIISITEKFFPFVIGDGKHTLEELILNEAPLLAMARYYFQFNHARLFDVIPEGERVQLIDLGTHCRGAVFGDARKLINERLEQVFDKISASYEGFYFGRYDVRVSSKDDFAAGHGFKIIELNGVTSEVTHIYEHGYPLRQAYNDLFEQWRLAYEIGGQNIKLTGSAHLGLAGLVNLLTQEK